MTDRKDLTAISQDAAIARRAAEKPQVHEAIESDPKLEAKIHRIAGNIRSIRVQILRKKMAR